MQSSARSTRTQFCLRGPSDSLCSPRYLDLAVLVEHLRSDVLLPRAFKMAFSARNGLKITFRDILCSVVIGGHHANNNRRLGSPSIINSVNAHTRASTRSGE